jgi:hypothetical protein
MSETVIHLDGALPLAVLDERGWVQGAWESAGGVCVHQAIRLCAPVPGDAHLIERVAKAHGHGPDWNDDDATSEADVRAWLAEGIDVTDDDLAEVFGPQWRAVVSLVRRAATLTVDEAGRLRAARGGAAWVAAWDAARVAAWDAARVAAGDAAGGAAGVAARDAAWDAARVAAGGAAGGAAWDAAWAVVTWDLATGDGPYTEARRDLLIGPWVEVCGLPEGLIEREDMD